MAAYMSFGPSYHKHSFLKVKCEMSGWSKIKKRAKQFLTGKWSPNSTQVPAKKIRNTNKHAETYSTKLNNELNKKDDWNAI